MRKIRKTDIPFLRGRDARIAGKERMCMDARLRGDARQEWYRGWDYQDRLYQPRFTESQAVAARNAFRAMREAL